MSTLKIYIIYIYITQEVTSDLSKVEELTVLSVECFTPSFTVVTLVAT